MHDKNTIPGHETRREFLTSAGGVILLPHAVSIGAKLAPAFARHQATGVRVGEVTENSAIAWTRPTKYANSNNDGVAFANRGEQQEPAPVAFPIEKIPVEKSKGHVPI